ncbi:MAG: leucine-rich repeat domain-containing protein [Deltaproteobacteria bacterium]|nr:leucine-rich repeat domain-containing protein [Deltaproteobacteria bacterium]
MTDTQNQRSDYTLYSPLLAYLLLSLPLLICRDPLLAQGATASYRGFLFHCQNRAQTSHEIQHTVDQLHKLTGMSSCQLSETHLKRKPFLVMRFMELRDLRPLTEFTQLTDLSLGGNSISDLSPLSELKNLISLNLGGQLGGNLISDLSPLKSLNKLETLIINRNQISDLTVFRDPALVGLKHLELARNQIEDLRPLEQLVNLEVLSLRSNKIRDISALEKLTKLRDLDLNNNKIISVLALIKLRQLHTLRIRYNHLKDFAEYPGLRKIKQIEY